MVALADPSYPGQVLKGLFLDPLNMSADALAARLKVPRTRIERLMKEETAMTADTALRLARFFGNSAEFWMNLQRAFDLNEAR